MGIGDLSIEDCRLKIEYLPARHRTRFNQTCPQRSRPSASRALGKRAGLRGRRVMRNSSDCAQARPPAKRSKADGRGGRVESLRSSE